MSAPEAAVGLADGVTREYLIHHHVCPMRIADDGRLIIAAAPDAFLDDAVDDLAFAYSCGVTVEQSTADEVERLIERLTTAAERSVELERVDASGAGLDEDLTADVRDLANQPPVVRYVNLLVRDAYDAGASDIHLEAVRSGLSARFRLDGVLAPAPEPPGELHHAVVSRIKLLAELDIAERRRPQDGRIRVKLADRELDLRVSTVPTMFGESVVLRLLDRGGRPVELGELGMSTDVFDEVTRLSARPHGMVLVTGPTGSGKTTTLYACLERRQKSAEKIITVEDPVEYQLSGITQVPVHRQAGVTFATALRSILRQDPDVLMVGEMRDGETADLAVQAAMTGHLVFTTLHTNDAIGAIPRLIDLGVPEYLVAATIEAVLAQRLVRRVCAECMIPYEPNPESIALLTGRPPERYTLMHGAGCSACRGTGYRGRIGIFELLRMTDELKHAIVCRAPRAELRELAAAAGMRLMRSDGWTKVEEGLTTVEEVLRVS
jgi:type II secretory ATPase GspE/PulE/Tfp pilus assembly ATPase PilB-like protein